MESSRTTVDEDICIMVGGQGGDGSLTVTALLAGLFRRRGLNVYSSRNVLSRIKGGHADGVVRASRNNINCLGDHVKVVVAFDEEAVLATKDDLDPNATIIFDSSAGELDPKLVDNTVKIYNIPFTKLILAEIRRELFKNSASFAVVGRLLGFPDEEMLQSLNSRYGAKDAPILENNIRAFKIGLEWAGKNGLTAADSTSPNTVDVKQKLLMTGNEAVSYGLLVGGVRFFAGYPITPATDVMEYLQKWFPKFGGVVKQAEDELSAINMALGAALAGARSVIATSGPGLSLIHEGMGQAGAAEIPLVIVDTQRAGPSTGLPTKIEQSDLQTLVYGGHGEFPRLVLTPGSVEDCFNIGRLAPNLAEMYQLPVIIAMDLGICQNTVTIESLDLHSGKIDRGKRLTKEDLAKMPVYGRYSFTDDGVSPYTVPSTENGRFLITGNEHNEFGHVNTDKLNRVKMMEKRSIKMKSALKDLPRGTVYGDESSKIGFIGIGSTYGVILEAMGLLAKEGVSSKYYKPLTILPLEDAIGSFLDSCDEVYVVEQNQSGQLSNLITLKFGRHKRLHNILKFDGNLFRPREISQRVLQIREKQSAIVH
ncbi:MAG: 2-oxoacid:acceptor oxidoreductase subunit alpha [Thaumarchaeota archaeon]|nr:2-oxoacid:acceptor oxidoreductase subunit alpha [Nitrososphaerota archaeon]